MGALPTLHHLRRLVHRRQREQATSARAFERLNRHRLASAMHRAAARDQLTLARIEDFVRELDGSVRPPHSPSTATVPADSVQGVVAANVLRNQDLQTKLHEAAEDPAMPRPIRRWLHTRVVQIERRIARVEWILSGERRPALVGVPIR